MSRNERIVWIAGFGAIVLVVVLWLGTDVFQRRSVDVDCPDGRRRTIDLHAFTTTYSAYALELEAQLGTGKLAGKLEPRQLQAMTDASQQANEFRKFVVAGYNSCAVTAAEYVRLGARFQTLDGLARQIGAFSDKPDLSDAESAALADLVRRYADEAARVAAGS